MKIKAIIDLCIAKNVAFSLAGEQLTMTGQTSSLSSEEIALIRDRKAELVYWLKQQRVGEQAIPVVERVRDSFIVSSEQRRLWYVNQIEGGSAHYNVPTAFAIDGSIDIELLQQALDLLVERHEPLRTVFIADAERGVLQKPLIDVSCPFTVEDFSSESEADSLAAIDSAFAKEAATSFDLARDLPIRARFFRRAFDKGVLLLIIHHIATDGWSNAILLDELVKLYDMLSRCGSAELPPLPVSYIDYAQWQANYQAGDAFRGQLDYWLRQLQDLPQLHSLPLDKVRPKTQRFAGENIHFELDGALSDSLKDLAKAHNTTLFTLTHALFALLLMRWSNEDEVTVGVPFANRNREELRSLVGIFINNKVLRARRKSQQSFAEYLQDIAQVNRDAIAAQDVPFEILVEQLNPERSLSHAPLFQIMLTVNQHEIAVSEAEQASMLRIRPWQAESNAIKLDLHLDITDGERGLQCSLMFNNALWTRQSIVAMAQSFQTLCQQVVANPQGDINRLALLEQHAVAGHFEQYQADSKPFDAHLNMAQLIEIQAAATPNAVAVSCEGESMTYAELNGQANRLAHHLIAEGVVGELIGVYCDRAVTLPLAMLAIFKAGGVYVPLEPGLPQQRLEAMIADGNIRTVLCQRHLADHALPVANCWVIDDEQLLQQLAQYDDSNLVPAKSGPQDAAYVIYTSGSTGQPKGVVVEHRALVNRIQWMQNSYPLTGNDKVLQKTPVSFDVSMWELTWPLLCGATMLLARPNGHREPHYLSKLIMQNEVSVVHFVPSMFAAMMAEGYWGGCTSLRYVFCSGEVLPSGTARWHQRLNKAQLHNLYGPTEAAIDVSSYHINGPVEGDTVVIGKAIQNIHLLVLNNAMQMQPPGAIGELYIGGVGLAREYLNKPVLTAEKFVTNPFDIPGSPRLYRTGDAVRQLPDGNLQFLGRLDEQVKLRGHRIELGEIEHQLMALNEVEQTVVVLAKAKNGQDRLVAYIVVNRAMAADDMEELIRSKLQYSLPDYMIPAVFCPIERLPMKNNGKIDKARLPDISGLGSNTNYVAPSNELEETLCQGWQQTLQLGKVGIDDNYFGLGGDSIHSNRLLAWLSEQGIEVSLRDFFANPTPRQLAKAISQGTTGNLEVINRVEPWSLINEQQLVGIEQQRFVDAYPLAKMQQGMLYLNEVDLRGLVYRDIVGVRLNGRWDSDCFKRAIDTLVVRHEILRTVILKNDPNNLQYVLRHYDTPIGELDLRHLKKDAAEYEIEIQFAAERERRFDPQTPLWRIFAYRIEEQQTLVSFACHHAILDGWSIATFKAELAIVYQAFLDNRPLPNLPKPLKYNAYIANEIRAIQSTSCEAYWRAKLADANVPWWTGGKQVPTRLEMFDLSDLEPEIVKLARKLGSSISSVLLTAHMIMLSMMNGTCNIASSTLTHGRIPQHGGDRTLGLFLNTLPVVLDIRSKTWREMVIDIRAQQQDLNLRHYYPVAEVQRLVNMDFSGMLYNYLDFHITESLEGVTSQKDGRETHEEFRHDADSNYLLTVNFRHTKSIGALNMEMRVATAIFNDNELSSIQLLVREILQEMIRDIDARPETVDLLPAKMRTTLLDDYNRSGKLANPLRNVISRVAHWAAKHPNAVAVVHGQERLCYGELETRSNQIANRLQQVGVKHGQLIGLCAPRSIESVLHLLAIIKTGAAYLPIDADYPQERIDFLIDDSQVQLMLTVGDNQVLFADRQLNTLIIDSPSYCEEVAACADGSLAVEPALDDLVYVNYTSGTTGQPKGVEVTHSGVARLLEMAPLVEGGSDAVVLHAASLSFDAATFEIWGALGHGGTLVLYRGVHVDAEGINLEMREHGVTTAWLTAALFEQWSHQVPVGLALRWLYAGGDVVAPRAVERTYAKLPLVTVINGYGPTENTTFSCCYPVPRDADFSQPLPIGQAIPGSEVYVLAPNRTLVPAGAVGELYVGGPGLAVGYRHQPTLTAQKFVYCQLSGVAKPQRLYRTGDLVRYLPDGNLSYMGRDDQQVKIRGYRIELQEIEWRLSNHDLLKSSAVCARDFAEGDRRLVAYVVRNPAVTLESFELECQLRQAMSECLPEFMVPSYYIELPQLPLTVHGKLDRRALAELEVQRTKPQKGAGELNETEALIARIWAKLLDMTEQELSVDADFFDWGGHSLLANQLVAEIRRELIVEISPLDIFEHPELGQLASHVHERYRQAFGEFNDIIGQMWCELLDIPVEELRDDADFFDWGGHSLLANTLVGLIKKQFAIEFTALDIFEHPVFKSFVHHVKAIFDQRYGAITAQLMPIWQALLDLEPMEIQLGADFFDWGGHSLLANNLVAEIRHSTGVELTVLDVFNHPTLLELITLLGERCASQTEQNQYVEVLL